MLEDVKIMGSLSQGYALFIAGLGTNECSGYWGDQGEGWLPNRMAKKKPSRLIDDFSLWPST